MNKENLINGIVNTIFGAFCVVVGLIANTKNIGVLWAFGGAYTASGIITLCQYFYWTSPKRKEKYEKRFANVIIEQNDELNIKMRDRAGRNTFKFMEYATIVAIMVVGVLGALDKIANFRPLMFTLCGVLLFQSLVYMVFFEYMKQTYMN